MTDLKKAGILLTASLLLFCGGLVFAWSVFALSIETDLNISRQSSSLVFPISLSVSILGQIIGGAVQKRKKSFLGFLLASFLFVTGFLLAANSHTITGLILAYGIIVGFAIGFIYNMVLANTVLWYTESTSVVSGLLLMCFGLGTVVLGSFSAGMIQILGWRFTFRVFAPVFGILSFVGAFVIRQPFHAVLKIDDNTSRTGPLDMIRHPEYPLFFSWLTLIFSITLIIPGHAALCAADIGALPPKAAFAVGCNAFSNVVSRLVLGYLNKKISLNIINWLLTLAVFLGNIFCFGGILTGSIQFLIMGYIVFGFVNGGITIAGNNYILNRYGHHSYGMNMGISNFSLVIGSFLGPAIAGIVRQRTNAYIGVFYFMSAIALCSVVLLIIWNRKEKG